MIDLFRTTKLLCLSCTLALLPAYNLWAQDVVLDQIRAVVNEGVILDSDIAFATEFYKQQAQSNRQALPPDEVLGERVLEQLIDQEIRRQHAKEIGVAVDPGTVNRAVEQIARNNNMDTLQFRQTIQQQGFNYNQFRQNIEQELLLQRLIERDVQARIRVSSQEIDDYVESARNDVADQRRYRIQHILVAVPPSASAQDNDAATVRAQAILERLRGGDDFSAIAAAESDGARALQGGDLGWRNLQEVPAFLAAALVTMDPGDISEPLRSANGLHVIQLSDRQSGDQTQQEETLARHIFIAGDGDDVEQELMEVREKLEKGISFELMAEEMSEDPNSASKGGELPWFTQGQMPDEMEEMAESLGINELSKPFRTQFGWHLLQVVDRRTSIVDEEALRQQATNALRERKVEQETERWSRQLRDESFVEIRS